MNPLLTYMSIAKTIASALLGNSGDKAWVEQWTGYLNFATALVSRWTAGTQALTVLDDQLKAAVAQKRGLTIEERTAWRARDNAATDIAQQWLLEHPKP